MTPRYHSQLTPLKTDNLPGISIVTPAYNSEKTISEAIESIISSKYPYLDYLIVDGNSKDSTVAIARRYRPAVRVLSEPDKGQSDAINKGFRLTKGEIIGWLNADDILYPGALQEVGEFFMDNPDVVGVYGDCELIEEDGKVLSRSGVQPFDRWRLIHSRNFIEQSSCFFRRDAFESVGGLDSNLKYVMDWELWIKLSRFGDLVYIPKVLSARRLTASNKTQSGGMERLLEIYRMLKKYGATWRSPVILNYFYETLATEARWGSGLSGFFAKIISPFLQVPLHPRFYRRFNDASIGSFPNGDIPQKGAVVIPPSPGHSTLVLLFQPVSLRDISCYKVKFRINRGIIGAVILRNGSEKPVEHRIEGLDSTRFNLIEFSSSYGAEKYEEFWERDFKIATTLKWAWV